MRKENKVKRAGREGGKFLNGRYVRDRDPVDPAPGSSAPRGRAGKREAASGIPIATRGAPAHIRPAHPLAPLSRAQHSVVRPL